MKTDRLICIMLAVAGVSFVAGRAPGDDDWTNLNPPTTPEARFGHSLVTLPDGRVVMFGGQGENNTLFNDLNFFMDNWVPVTPTNDPPPARAFHKAWVQGDAMFVYGGVGASQAYDDLWRYDTLVNSWTDITPEGPRPAARYGHTATAMPDGRTLIFGGIANFPSYELWLYDPSDQSFAQLRSSNIAYSYHNAVWVAPHYLYVFGLPNTLTIYDFAINDWYHLDGYGPPSYAGRGAALLYTQASGTQMVRVFGGLNAEGQTTSDIYEFNLDTSESTLRDPAGQPIPSAESDRAGTFTFAEPSTLRAASTLDETPTSQTAGYGALFFGGRNGKDVHGDTMLFWPTCPVVYRAGAGGAIDGVATQRVAYGTSASAVAAAPEDGAEFDQWSDGSGSSVRVDTNVTESISVEASFRSLGQVPIDWYARYDIAPDVGETWAAVDQRDPHGKNMTHRDEYVALTDPTNPGSRFLVTSVVPGQPCDVFVTPSATGRVYTLQQCQDLSEDTWTNVTGQIGVPGGTGPLHDESGVSEQRFYRVLVDVPD